nr:MAG TPA: radical SAM peptide maturase, CXXX-repeat target family [Caudoviricetes sp.]
MKKTEEYGNTIARLFPHKTGETAGNSPMHHAVKTVTIQTNDSCPLHCTYCLDGDTKILMKDFDEKPIRDVLVGDEIIAFEEYPVERKKRSAIISATVKNVFHRKAEVLKMTFDDGRTLLITPNHKILARRNAFDEHEYDFREAGRFKVGQLAYSLPINFLKKCNNDYVNSNDYHIGYLVAMILGDGSLKHYTRKDGCDTYKFRIVVKDDEIISMCEKCLDLLHIDYYKKPFVINNKTKESRLAIFSNKKETYFELCTLIDNNFRKNQSDEYRRGFLAGIYDAEGHIANSLIIRITNTDRKIIDEIEACLDYLNIEYIEELSGRTKNHEYKWNIRITNGSAGSFRFLSNVSSVIKRKSYDKFIGKKLMNKTKVKSIEPYGEIDVYNIETTSGTYFANGIAVHNCYQINKGEHIIPIETAKTFIDKLLTNQYAEYIDVNDTDGIILEFIGGEPLVAIDIIDEITDYFIKQMILMNHKWLPRFRLSMISNGVLYFEPKVQEYLRKNAAHLSFGISIDGNKELHDACRVFPDGSGSYDMAMAAVQHFREHFTDKIGSKMTLCPENIMYTYDAVVSLIENGYDEVNLNCVYEEGWTDDDAKIMYQQLKKLADYIFENDLWDKVYLSIFEQSMFHPLSESDNTNYCGGNGAMLAIDWKGDMYPCIRYMESSVGDDVEPMIIGNVYDGIMKTQKQCDCVHCLWSITRRSQSTDECWNCPIASGCGACTAYNYQHFGDANHRATYICCTHKARALANAYYWNKGFRLNNEMKRFHLYLPDEDALKIIDEDELAMLKSLET